MPLPEFIEAPRFPTGISYGSSGGPQFRVEIRGSSSGREKRNLLWQDPRRSYDAGKQFLTDAQRTTLITFFHLVRGPLIGFRYKDEFDYSVTDEPFGSGDDAEVDFQLIKTYDDVLAPSGAEYVRTIAKPVSGSVTIYDDGSPVDPGDYTLDTTTGIVTFDTAPVTGHALTWTGEFDVPVRFDVDVQDLSQPVFDQAEWQVPLIEIRV